MDGADSVTWVHKDSATQNTGMVVEPEEEGKLAHERLQSALPVNSNSNLYKPNDTEAKTRRQTTTHNRT
jgi:hypothetical protein